MTMPNYDIPILNKIIAAPTFIDCYPQAKWNGKKFIETGAAFCLDELD